MDFVKVDFEKGFREGISSRWILRRDSVKGSSVEGFRKGGFR